MLSMWCLCNTVEGAGAICGQKERSKVQNKKTWLYLTEYKMPKFCLINSAYRFLSKKKYAYMIAMQNMLFSELFVTVRKENSSNNASFNEKLTTLL